MFDWQWCLFWTVWILIDGSYYIQGVSLHQLWNAPSLEPQMMGLGITISCSLARENLITTTMHISYHNITHTVGFGFHYTLINHHIHCDLVKNNVAPGHKSIDPGWYKFVVFFLVGSTDSIKTEIKQGARDKEFHLLWTKDFLEIQIICFKLW